MISLEKTNKELIEYFDHINQSLLNDFAYVKENTDKIIAHPNASDRLKADVQWALGHLQADLLKLHETIKRYQKDLRDAGKQI